MMGGARMMDWEEQLWTHTSMVMVGTSNHSDAAMRSSTVTAITAIIIAIDRTAAITLRPTPAPIWREADIAHVSRSHEEVSNVVEEAYEAVEPTTMTMTSDEGSCIPLPSNQPTKQPSERAKDTAWQGAQHQQQLMCGCIVDERAICLSSISTSLVVVTGPQQQRLRPWIMYGVMCVDVLLPRMTTMMTVVSARWPFSSQALMTRAGRYTHTQMCEKRRHQPSPCDVALLRRARDSGQH
ncbi:hypothetical protein PTSG_11956, partial [Salpingoeca rosetta]